MWPYVMTLFLFKDKLVLSLEDVTHLSLVLMSEVEQKWLVRLLSFFDRVMLWLPKLHALQVTCW